LEENSQEKLKVPMGYTRVQANIIIYSSSWVLVTASANAVCKLWDRWSKLMSHSFELQQPDALSGCQRGTV